jgi:hypothetical protein
MRKLMVLSGQNGTPFRNANGPDVQGNMQAGYIQIYRDQGLGMSQGKT